MGIRCDLPDANISPQENVLNGKQALPPCHTLFQFYVSEMETRDYHSYFWYLLDNPNSTLDKHEVSSELINGFHDAKIKFPKIYCYQSKPNDKIDADVFC